MAACFCNLCVFSSLSNRMYICFFVLFFCVIFDKQLPLVMPQERPLVAKCRIDVVYEAEESEGQK